MTYKATDWPYLLAHDPKGVEDKFITAFLDADGQVSEAAQTLDISVRHWYQIVAKLPGLLEKLNVIRWELRVARRELRKKYGGHLSRHVPKRPNDVTTS